MKVVAVTGSKFASFGPYVPAVSGDRTLFYAKRAGTGDDAIFASNADGSEECLLPTGAVSHPVAGDTRWAVFAAGMKPGARRFLVINGESTPFVAGPLGPTLDFGRIAFRGRPTDSRDAAEGIFAEDGPGTGRFRVVAALGGSSGAGWSAFHGLPVGDAAGNVYFRGVYEGKEVLARAEVGAETSEILVRLGEGAGRFPAVAADGTCACAAGGDRVVLGWSAEAVEILRFPGFAVHGVLLGPAGGPMILFATNAGRFGIFVVGPGRPPVPLLRVGDVVPFPGGPPAAITAFAANRVSWGGGSDGLAVRVEAGDRGAIVRVG